jgi:hypothetical protein
LQLFWTGVDASHVISSAKLAMVALVEACPRPSPAVEPEVQS